MKIIVGLGNHGEKYQNTRHNVGFMVVEALVRKFQAPNFKFQINQKTNSQILKIRIGQDDVLLAKPQTMMNNSGYAVEKILRDYDIKILRDLWVIHDDLDLPLGKIKIKTGGGAAGHHGVESIIEQVGSGDFVRFRLGIGKPGGHDEWEKKNIDRRKVEDYVLDDFSRSDLVEAKKMVGVAVEAIETAMTENLDRAMNKFNLK
ncbi:MAG: aminoacyl-tRNA hydrolase [bacterium]|nr:aminoacyl-tRNA hydrolase [bacterium]